MDKSIAHIMARYWYAYNGTPGGENIPGNYILVTLKPDEFCQSGSCLCAIYAPEGGLTPLLISLNMQSYIVIAKARMTPFPALATQKPYVYTRTC